ncbi:unnamed protein product [Fusarium graminearum]|uniref:Chromosome 2, complete genome n=1 Tax=Gibberella zeae (strain ATCC MYA-4620 / CBS 123657 / FGSC 9075 / NRRL 31084 / PH-1) TaxID=229533 RepID=A0A098DM93_GIBZE|nr:unnamed protein product [Fusarium graminearum]
MASAAVQDVQRIQTEQLKSQYGNKLSNQFVDELKSSTMFQYDWSELISAAPTALALMGSLWIAAADPKADKISMVKSMPTGGFKHIPNRAEPTLRSCLVDVCNNGGRTAFTVAGANMDALQIISKRIVDERITVVFQRLGPCTVDEDALEDFNDALQSFNDDAQRCAKLATETRQAFATWGLMVGELHACTEAESGITSIQKEATRIQEETTKVEEKFAVQAQEDAKSLVEAAAKSLKRAEDRLDKSIEKVPSALESMVGGIVSGFTQSIPQIMSSVVPQMLAASNPGLAAASALVGGSMAQQASANGTASNGARNGSNAAPTATSDPSYAAATGIRDLVNYLYEYLGGDAGQPDWSKFEYDSKTGTQGVAYFLGTIQSQQSNVEVTNTEPNKKLMGVYSTLKSVIQEIGQYLKDQNDISASKSPDAKVKSWKATVKGARNDVLSLAAAGNVGSSSSVPNPFANVPATKPDNSAQIAQLNSASQAVQIAQNAVDAKQDAYDAAIAKQQKSAAAMSNIQQNLKRLQEQGKTLEEIKSVLRNCISVLVDLAAQIGKLEQFFIMLTTVIDNIIMVRANDFTKEMSKGGRRALRNGVIKFDDLAKTTIYTSTLQLKGYFSLLQDISHMYTIVDKPYVRDGLDLCGQLSKGTASGQSSVAMQEQLSIYMDKTGKVIKDIIAKQQKEIVDGLKDRVRKAAETSQLVEDVIAKSGLPVSKDAKAAIESGAEAAKEDAKRTIDDRHSETVSDNERKDSSNW